MVNAGSVSSGYPTFTFDYDLEAGSKQVLSWPSVEFFDGHALGTLFPENFCNVRGQCVLSVRHLSLFLGL